MQLIVGLGNPGSKYDQTRHNIGFMAVDLLAAQLQISALAEKKQLSGLMAKRGSLVLLKPTTFMNNSGLAVRATWEYFASEKITELSADDAPHGLYVIHDDLDLPVGQWKIQFGTGPKGHNGLLSIYEHLGTDQFWHVRIGVDGRTPEMRQAVSPADYVLQPFAQVERAQITSVIDEVVAAVPVLK